MSKKYSRKNLIAYFKKLPPRSKPFMDGRCPIAVATNMKSMSRNKNLEGNKRAGRLDMKLAAEIDEAADTDFLVEPFRLALNYSRLTAARIVKIAEALTLKEKKEGTS